VVVGAAAGGCSGAREGARAPAALWWPAILLRNALFAALALGTGLRRLLPPY
jgi:hypothetical protein